MPLKSEYKAYDFVNKCQMDTSLPRRKRIVSHPNKAYEKRHHHHYQGQNRKYQRSNIEHPAINRTGSDKLHEMLIQQNPNYNSNSNDFHVQPYRNPQYAYQTNIQQQYYGQQQQYPSNPNNRFAGPCYPQCGDNRYMQRPTPHGYNNYPQQQNNCEDCWHPNNNMYPHRGNMQYPHYNRPETAPQHSNMKYFGSNQYNQQKECNVCNLNPQNRNEWYAMNPQGILKINQPNQPQQFMLGKNFSTVQAPNTKEITINSNCLKETKEPQEILIKDQHGVPQGILKYNRRTAKKPPPQSNDAPPLETNEANNDESKIEKVNAGTTTSENAENTDPQPSKKSKCSWRVERLSRPKTCIY